MEFQIHDSTDSISTNYESMRNIKQSNIIYLKMICYHNIFFLLSNQLLIIKSIEFPSLY